MKCITYTLFLLFLFAEQTFAQQENTVRLSVTKEEREEYQNEVQHFITHTYYDILVEAIATTEVHTSFINYLMQDEAVKYMPEFISNNKEKRYMTPTQYFGCLHRNFSNYIIEELHFSVNNMSLDDNFYPCGLRGCYIRAEYDLEIKYQEEILSRNRCRMYCVFPNKSSKNIIKVMQLEPIKDLNIKKKSHKQEQSAEKGILVTLREKAKQGETEALFLLGEKYYTGYEITMNYAEAVKWFKKAAKKGHPEAQCYLGDCYRYGHGVTIDYSEAIKWYRKAAEQEFPKAQYNLGNCYYYGRGVEKDYYVAVKWFQRSANKKYVKAECSLGDCYYYGRGVLQNYNKAVDWYIKANRYPRAMCYLGNCYYYGYGVSKDYQKAVDLYRKSANQGYEMARYNLGICYMKGHGVPQDCNEAIKWFRRAAEQGHAKAKLLLQELEIQVIDR